MKRLIIIAILLSNLVTQSNAKYHLVKIYIENNFDFHKLLSLNLDLESAATEKDEINLIINDFEKESLSKSGLKFQLLIEDYESFLANRIEENFEKFATEETQDFEFGSMGGFYKLEEITSQFEKLRQSEFFVERKEIGYSWENRPIIAYCFGSKDTTKPELLVTALHHSREPATVTTVLYFLQTLLNKAKDGDKESKFLLENRRLWVIPVLNPDGYYYNQTKYPNGGGLWRKNRRPINQTDTGVDLNRNYGPFDFWNANNNGSSTNPKNETYRGPAPFSEPEIVALRNFCMTRNFRLALNFHTYGGMLIYPYSALPYETPDSNWFRSFGIHIHTFASYYFGTDRQTVGYPTRGSSDDWFYTPDSTKGKVFAFSPEASYQFDGFWPGKERIIPIAKENYPLLLNFLWSAGPNIRLKDFYYYFDTTRKTGYLELTFQNIGLETSPSLTNVRISSTKQNYYLDTLLEISELEPAEQTNIRIQMPIPNENFENGTEVALLISIFQDNIERNDTITITLYEYQTIDLKDSTIWDFSASKWGYEINPDSSYILLCDSPNKNYADSLDNFLPFKAPYKLSANNFELEITSRWAIEPFYDYAKIEISTNNGKDWTPLRFKRSTIASGNQYGKQKLGEFGFAGHFRFWNTQITSLRNFIWKDILLRLSLLSDKAKNFDGWDIKDLKLRSYPKVSFKNYVSAQQIASKLLFFNKNQLVCGIEVPEIHKISEIKVYDLLGRCVFLNNPDGKSTIDLPSLPYGIYLVAIKLPNGFLFNKLMIK
ncbi:MAG: M14 family zinc carboxypeptidase [Candidatus Kapaibacteriota bacterium]